MMRLERKEEDEEDEIARVQLHARQARQLECERAALARAASSAADIVEVTLPTKSRIVEQPMEVMPEVGQQSIGRLRKSA